MTIKNDRLKIIIENNNQKITAKKYQVKKLPSNNNHQKFTKKL